MVEHQLKELILVVVLTIVVGLYMVKAISAAIRILQVVSIHTKTRITGVGYKLTFTSSLAVAFLA